ncbi:C-type lectin domain family 12 member B [Fukomys damarensis]|uniref:C-type lectin domain family 12 member B n=1 Tax=Fukomys damarensis TaxID=885580 RepID=A0A091D3C3_FUKDA|nr:C-type lectin domain family 12 member B [Fukomys damarensis]
MSREMNSDSEKLSQLPKVIHHQQDNLSQQLDNNRTFSMEKEFLKSQVSKTTEEARAAGRPTLPRANHSYLRFSNKELDQINGSKGCAYFQRGNIYVSRCSAEIPWICEKTATPVKIEDLD